MIPAVRKSSLVLVVLATLASVQTTATAVQPRVLRIGVRSDVRFILTDPDGRSAGFDRNTGLASTQIPLSTPNQTCSVSPNPSKSEPCFREITIENPVTGEYRMAVVGAQGGSYELYWSDETKGHRSGRRFPELPIGTGEWQVYDFRCAVTPGQDSMRGDFTGSEAEGAADDLLTWGRPRSAIVRLPPDSKAYDVIIVYGPTINPASFRAQLFRQDVTHLFHPAPQKIEPVTLRLQPGRNILKVTVNGNIDSRNAVDTDTLEFTVPGAGS